MSGGSYTPPVQVALPAMDDDANFSDEKLNDLELALKRLEKAMGDRFSSFDVYWTQIKNI